MSKPNDGRKANPALTMAQFMAGLRQEEHGGSYTWVINADGAHGAYQIVDWDTWARNAGVNPSDHSKAAQDAVAEHAIRGYLHEFGGNWAMVAAAWLGGSGGAQEWAAGGDPSDGNTTTSQYVANVLGYAGFPRATILSYKPANAQLGTIPPQSGGGGGGGGNAAFNAPKEQSVQDYLSDPRVAQTYGYLSAFLKDPVIGPILARAAKHGWGADELQGALMKTKWWKTTSDTARQWEAQKRLDPATANQTLAATTNQIQQLAQSTLGRTLGPNDARAMANAAVAANWSNAQLQEAIGAQFQYQGAQAKYKGAAGQTIDTLQQMSSQYLVPISHKSYEDWTKGILEGNNTTDDFKSYLQAQAESLYPTLTSALKSGITVQQYADPYLQMASQILEKPTGAFDLFNPKWSKALNTVQPDGQRAPMTLSDWGDYLRSLPEYKQTAQAQQQAGSFDDALLNIFGKISTPDASASGLDVSSQGVST